MYTILEFICYFLDFLKFLIFVFCNDIFLVNEVCNKRCDSLGDELLVRIEGTPGQEYMLKRPGIFIFLMPGKQHFLHCWYIYPLLFHQMDLRKFIGLFNYLKFTNGNLHHINTNFSFTNTRLLLYEKDWTRISN